LKTKCKICRYQKLSTKEHLVIQWQPESERLLTIPL
jgi:hypothetical protein